MARRILFICFILTLLPWRENLRAQVPERVTKNKNTILPAEHTTKLNPSQQLKIPPQRPGVVKVFEEVEKGILDGNVKNFSTYFSRQLYVNLRGGENGYYSANQVFYLLQNFFGARRTLHFKFTTYGETDNVPYGTGGGTFTIRGNRETFQIYVALTKLKDRWLIAQFNAY